MKTLIHPLAGTLATLTIAAFWLSTAISELFGTPETVALVKTAIPWGFLLLIPALMVTGAAGLKLARGRRGGLIGAKLRRMPIIAANGLVVLVPAALFLAAKARAGAFDGTFYAVQAIELVAGAANLCLLALSLRDGIRLSGRLRRGR
jgi:hypothetical protein